jgi:DhnA family fructose-bisphosphate aldolase class Ia
VSKAILEPRAAFKEAWDYRLGQAQAQAKAMGAQLIKVEQQVNRLLERILDASLPSVIMAYENRIRALEEEKLVIHERVANAGGPKESSTKHLERRSISRKPRGISGVQGGRRIAARCSN